MTAMTEVTTAILADLEAWFKTPDVEARERLAARLAAHPEFRRESLSGWLHRLDLFRKVRPGRLEIRVPVGCGHERLVTLRIPRGYLPGRPWPLLYALHSSGGNGRAFTGYVEKMLGPRIEEFIVAAPTAYRQTSLDAPPPFTVDHLAMLRAVRRTVHVDSDRVYALGTSLGGYASWAIACLHPDQLAGAVPISSCFSIPPGEDGLWKTVLPNFSHLPVLNVWGANDTLTVLGVRKRSPMGGIARLNDVLVRGSKGLTPTVQNVCIPGRGHGGVQPPRGPFFDLLSRRREHYPRQVDHTFRHLHQGHSYWLEAHRWEGGHWGAENPPYQRRPRESEDQAFGRAVRELLGNLRGQAEGQTLRVDRRHVDELTVWLGEGMVDWAAPVTVTAGGREVFAERVKPDLGVCLAEAERTGDFDRLRWAGVRIGPDLRAEPVTARTEFPPLAAD
jgi:pimeloyl-ACP methyl ester carboxylesterase